MSRGYRAHAQAESEGWAAKPRSALPAAACPWQSPETCACPAAARASPGLARPRGPDFAPASLLQRRRCAWRECWTAWTSPALFLRLQAVAPAQKGFCRSASVHSIQVGLHAQALHTLLLQLAGCDSELAWQLLLQQAVGSHLANATSCLAWSWCHALWLLRAQASRQGASCVRRHT